MRIRRETFSGILLFISSLAHGQDISGKYPELIERVKSINGDTSLIKVVLTNEEFMKNPTDGGGELTGYFRGPEIKKIRREIGLSYGLEVYDYYFHNGKLIFVYEVLNGFLFDEEKEMLDHSMTEVNFIGRYYFKDGKLFDSETTGHNRFEDDSLDIEKTLTAEAAECLRWLSQKSKSQRN
jgi:hypothetical protein